MAASAAGKETDRLKTQELEKAIDAMSDERQEIYRGNEDAMRSVEERHAPIMSECFEEKARANVGASG
jgi:hypothetical protein